MSNASVYERDAREVARRFNQRPVDSEQMPLEGRTTMTMREQVAQAIDPVAMQSNIHWTQQHVLKQADAAITAVLDDVIDIIAKKQKRAKGSGEWQVLEDVVVELQQMKAQP